MECEILTADQLAARLQVGRRTILKWVKDGIIPVIRPSSKVLRFDAGAVAQALTVQPKVEDTSCKG